MEVIKCECCNRELLLGDIWWGECSHCHTRFKGLTDPLEYINRKYFKYSLELEKH